MILFHERDRQGRTQPYGTLLRKIYFADNTCLSFVQINKRVNKPKHVTTNKIKVNVHNLCFIREGQELFFYKQAYVIITIERK